MTLSLAHGNLYLGSNILATCILLNLYIQIFDFPGMIQVSKEGSETNERQEDLELPLFDLDTVVNATHNFSRNNKLGEGGFGPVYKVKNMPFLSTDINTPLCNLMIGDVPNL